MLLAVTRLDNCGYGMTLRQEIEERTDRDVSIGALYATLERLEKKGLVSSSQGESTASRGGRAKRFFAITERGLEALRRSRQLLDSMWEGVEIDLPATRR